MLRGAYCLSRVDHVRKIRDRKQRTDIGKYSFVNRNQLPGEELETLPCKPKNFRNRVSKLGGMKGIEAWRKSSKSAGKLNGVKCSDVR
jgi:hypothetical protein